MNEHPKSSFHAKAMAKTAQERAKDASRREVAMRREGAMPRAVMHSATWNQLHNVKHPRGADVQRKLQFGHALSQQDLCTLRAAPTASWWSQKDVAMAPSAEKHHLQGKVLDSAELSALRARSTSRLPRTLPSLHHYAGQHQDRGAETSNRPLVSHQSPSQQALGYKQRIALESTVPEMGREVTRNLLGPFPGEVGEMAHSFPRPLPEEPDALSAPRLDAATAAERCAARDCRVAELQAQIRTEQRQRRRLERSISEPALPSVMAAVAAVVPDAWFEERDAQGHSRYIHLDGKRTTRQRPTQGKVYGVLSYGMFGPDLGVPRFGN